MPKDDCCCTAMLSALVHTAGALSFGREGIGAEIISETPCVVSVAALLTKRLYDAECEFSHNQLSLKGGYVLEMLFDLGILTYEGEGVGAYPGDKRIRSGGGLLFAELSSRRIFGLRKSFYR